MVFIFKADVISQTHPVTHTVITFATSISAHYTVIHRTNVGSYNRAYYIIYRSGSDGLAAPAMDGALFGPTVHAYYNDGGRGRIKC